MRHLIVAAAAASAAATAGGFSEVLAKKLLLLSDAAYCGDAEYGGTAAITQWTCAPCQLVAPLSDVAVFADAERQTFGFTGVTDNWAEGEHVVVSFRGSVLDQNYVDDADTQLIESPSGRAGKVHRGFWKSFATLRAEMLEQVKSLLLRYPDSKGILVTGHSLGAAQAVHGADELSSVYPNIRITMYSFGTPKTGNSIFAGRLNATANLETWAVAHRADAIPICGVGTWPCHNARDGYHQIARDVWYPDGLAPVGPEGYMICDGSGEDPTCQNGLLVRPDGPKLLNWDDHNVYFGHTMFCCDDGDRGPSKEGCPWPFPPRNVSVQV